MTPCPSRLPRRREYAKHPSDQQASGRKRVAVRLVGRVGLWAKVGENRFDSFLLSLPSPWYPRYDIGHTDHTRIAAEIAPYVI